VKQLNAAWSSVKGITVTTGVVLSGQPGTGKTMIGRLIATQTRRSFYPLSAADILGGQVGGSVKKLSEVFARARENSPSIIFFDEIDGLMPRNNGMQSTHDTQLVEQCRTEISQLLPEHKRLLDWNNEPSGPDRPCHTARRQILREDRNWRPGAGEPRTVAAEISGRVQFDVAINRLVERVAGLSPADIEAICKTAVRNALGRSARDNYIPPLSGTTSSTPSGEL